MFTGLECLECVECVADTGPRRLRAAEDGGAEFSFSFSYSSSDEESVAESLNKACEILVIDSRLVCRAEVKADADSEVLELFLARKATARSEVDSLTPEGGGELCFRVDPNIKGRKGRFFVESRDISLTSTDGSEDNNVKLCRGRCRLALPLPLWGCLVLPG